MKILIATDGSTYSEAAVETACRLIMKPEESAFKVLSVYKCVVPLDTFTTSVEYSQELEDDLQIQAEGFAESAAATIRKCISDPNLDLTTQVQMGASAQVILDAAKDWNADLIVVGSHGRGFWGRIMLGSVSDAIIHHAHCSVLVVRPNKNQAADEHSK